MRIIHNAHLRPPSADEHLPLAWLEIERGTTRFPLRPITSPRFLIGSGTNCHLLLASGPLLHSLLARSAGGWTIEAIWPEPELLVNSAPCRCCRLYDGDLIQVGQFRFRFVLPTADRQRHHALDRAVAIPA